MKLLKLVLLSLLICNGVFAQSTSASLIKKVEGFSHPESVVFNEQEKEFYVSNMGGKEDGDGFISRVSAEGKIVDLKWIEDLKDPKGLLVVQDKLYVTNNTELIEIDIQNSEINKRISVTGAVSLNDLALDTAGSIYISDLGKSAIFMMDNKNKDSIFEYLNSKNLERVNGLYAKEDFLYAAAWGENQDGNVLKIDMETRGIERITKNGIGNLDGIQPVGDSAFYISDWATGKIYLAKINGDLKEVLTSEKSAGDIYFDVEKNQLVLPMNHQNAVWWYQLK